MKIKLAISLLFLCGLSYSQQMIHPSNRIKSHRTKNIFVVTDSHIEDHSINYVTNIVTEQADLSGYYSSEQVEQMMNALSNQLVQSFQSYFEGVDLGSIGSGSNIINYYVTTNINNITQVISSNNDPVNTVSWNNITGKPSTFPHSAISWSEITGKPSILSDNAIAWGEVTGKPTIPTKVSQLNNDSGFLTATTLRTSTSVADPHIEDAYVRVDAVNGNDSTGALGKSKPFKSFQAAYKYRSRTSDNINIIIRVPKGEIHKFYWMPDSHYMTGGQLHIWVNSPDEKGTADCAGEARIYMIDTRTSDNYLGVYNMYWHLGNGFGKLRLGLASKLASGETNTYRAGEEFAQGYKYVMDTDRGKNYRVMFHGIGAYLRNCIVYMRFTGGHNASFTKDSKTSGGLDSSFY